MPRPPRNRPIVCEHYAWPLFQRDGVWYADGRAVPGSHRKHSLNKRDYEEALRELRDLDVRIASINGIAVANPTHLPPDMSIDEGWRLYMEYCGRSQGMGGVAPTSLKRYRSIQDKHVTWCREHDVKLWVQFDRLAYERYGNWMFQKYAPRTCYTDLTQIKSAVTWLIDEAHLPSECRIVYRLRKPEGSDTYCPRPEEVDALVRKCDQDPKLLWLGHVLFALAHLGLRIRELAGLRWSDFDASLEFVRIADERASGRKAKASEPRTTKGRRSRVIPVHPRLRERLASIGRRPDGRVVHAALGGMLRPDNARPILIRDVIEPLEERFPTPEGEIGFESVRFHSLRHFFCSQCFLGGASEGEIREWMGHADSKIVELYRHLRKEDAARKMQQIEFIEPKKEAR